MPKNHIIERWRFWLDSQLSKGTSVLLLILVAVVVVSLVIVTGVIVIAGVVPNADMSVFDTMWTVFAYMYDPTSVYYNEGVWAYRILLLAASLIGVVVLSTLIGIITTSFNSLIENLRKGKSPVTITGHTTLLGWSDQIFNILNELIVANENHADHTVVILADKDKVEMEDEIRARIPDRKTTKIVCRNGSPIDRTDLEIVRPQASQSIIITPSDQGEDLDTMVVKCLLAILKTPRQDNRQYNIVASMKGERNRSAAQVLGGSQAHLVPAEQIIAQIIAQTCRQPGLSLVYAELLDFEGDEIYIVDAQEFTGRKFGEILLSVESSTIIGLKLPSGSIKINPPLDEIIGEGTAIIVLSTDDDTIVSTSRQFDIDESAVVTGRAAQAKDESFLVLGWNDRGDKILRELDHYVPKGTRLVVVDHSDMTHDFNRLSDEMNNLAVTSRLADHTDRNVLNSASISDYSSIIILADTELGIQEADAQTLMTLIHLRDMLGQSDLKINIVTEMLDDRNRELAALSDTNDFIVSNKIIALMLTQISENRDLYDVFIDLFSAEGSELYLKPITDYVVTSRPVTFATVVMSAAARGQLAIGYKIHGDAQSRVRLNVSKAETMHFGDADQVIVISDH